MGATPGNVKTRASAFIIAGALQALTMTILQLWEGRFRQPLEKSCRGWAAFNHNEHEAIVQELYEAS